MEDGFVIDWILNEKVFPADKVEPVVKDNVTSTVWELLEQVSDDAKLVTPTQVTVLDRATWDGKTIVSFCPFDRSEGELTAKVGLFDAPFTSEVDDIVTCCKDVVDVIVTVIPLFSLSIE